VRTKGRLELLMASTQRQYTLRGTFGETVLVLPVPDVGGEFEQEAGLHWMGKEIEVTGLFQQSTVAANNGGPRFLITFWSYTGPPEEVKGPIAAKSLTLEELVTRPGKHDGQTVRVVGKFRGRNLYGDLPGRSELRSSDWVVKDDLFAVWITNKKPKGPGWDLDASLKRDTGKWLEIIGQPQTRAGVVYIRAVQVNLTTPPTPTAEAQPPSPPPPKPKLPPVVVFALPLDGESDVPQDSHFIVQFSKDMNEESFRGRVVMRYSGPVRPGDRPFVGLHMSYDGGHRALLIDPGDTLRPGRRVEILLLPGIADIDGMALIPRPGKQPSDFVDVFSWQVAS